MNKNILNKKLFINKYIYENMALEIIAMTGKEFNAATSVYMYRTNR